MFNESFSCKIFNELIMLKCVDLSDILKYVDKKIYN